MWPSSRLSGILTTIPASTRTSSRLFRPVVAVTGHKDIVPGHVVRRQVVHVVHLLAGPALVPEDDPADALGRGQQHVVIDEDVIAIKK